MKKLLLGVSCIIILFIISSYLFIPSKIIVVKSISVNTNINGVYRFLTADSNWQKWWPGSSAAQGSLGTSFNSGGYQFKKTKTLYNSFEIARENDGYTENSLLNIFSYRSDSIKIEWSTIVNTGTNPFSKIPNYFKAKELRNKMADILAVMQNYLSHDKNVYGLDIKKEKVKIEFLISVKKEFTSYPNTENIYEMIGQLKNYITRLEAKEEGYPMLHVNTPDSAHFEVQMAIPVNKKLPGTDIFSSKWMLKNGNILVSEITGGKNLADSAMKRIDQYILDYDYRIVAIPFQSLVTDRLKEPDSSKWLTRIYYPIR